VNKKVNIINKSAKFEYILMDQFSAGIVLTGTEIKSIRDNKASISESFCEFNDSGELFIINMFIDEYRFGNQFNHKTRNTRKLLLNKNELNKLLKEVKNTGLTIIPLKVFINDKGYAKVLISLAKGKKLFDKRQTIKNRENKVQLDRIKKNN
jgi:SsrA-binding protein